jgi:3-phosphoshikimate 1-carboxyvinyltransferase
MMAAVIATHATGPSAILGAECVEKSYPTFFDDLRALGGQVTLA